MTASEFPDPQSVPSEPVRNPPLPLELLEQIQAIYDVLGPFLSMSLDAFAAGFQRDADPGDEVGLWLGITAAWLSYHEQFLHDEVMSVADEQRLISALLAIASGVEELSELGVPAAIGRRLLDCYDRLDDELEESDDESVDE